MAGRPRKEKPEKVPKPMGRPRMKLDYKLVKKLCAIQCTGEEIANILEIDYDTLNSHIQEDYKLTFSEFFKKYSAKGKESLRRSQFALARKNAAMCIWLGKQYLGQKDEPYQDDKNRAITKVNVSVKVIGKDNAQDS